VLSQDVGIRIKGAASRSSVQKSFNVYARVDYGKDSLEYDFFGGEATKAKNGKVIDKFDSIVIRNGGIKGMVPKIYLPTYAEFDESRWFASGADFLSPSAHTSGRMTDDGKDYCLEGFEASVRYAGIRCNISPNLLFTVGRTTFGIEICEDFWAPVPPSSFLAPAGAQVILNLSASNEVMNKHAERRELVANQSGRTVSGYVYCSAGCGESTQDTGYGGSTMLCENGRILAGNLRLLGRDEGWLRKKLHGKGLRPEQVFLMTLTQSGEVAVFPRDFNQI
jgi:predicted amidohydrolase